MMVGSKLDRVEDLDLYRPADFDGKVRRLHYAQAEELAHAPWASWRRRGRCMCSLVEGGRGGSGGVAQ